MNSKLRGKNLSLDSHYEEFSIEKVKKKEEKAKNRPVRNFQKTMSAKEKREQKIFDIPPNLQKYEMYLPLHELWKQYIGDVIKDVTFQALDAKIVKADFHGAILKVVKSTCPSYIGVTGILVQETEATFKLISKENILKVVPKKNNVFTFDIGILTITIYGNHFILRSSERSVKKFKPKTTIEL